MCRAMRKRKLALSQVGRASCVRTYGVHSQINALIGKSSEKRVVGKGNDSN